MRGPLVEIYQQAVELGVPARVGLEEEKVSAGGLKLLLASRSAVGAVQSADESVWRLVDVVKATQVHAMCPEVRKAENGIADRFDLDRETVLNAVGHLVFLRKAHN